MVNITSWGVTLSHAVPGYRSQVAVLTDLLATSLALPHLTATPGNLVQNSSTGPCTASWAYICDPGGKALARLAAMGFPMAPRPMNPTDVGRAPSLDADKDMTDSVFGVV